MSALRQIFLVRHPKPDIAPGICYGSTDVPAAPAELSAALAYLDKLLPNDARIISSPLSRCAQLAELLGMRAQRSFKLDARLAERDCGAWELRAWVDVPRSELDAWAADFMGYSVPGAESVRQLQTRVLAAWKEHTGQLAQQPLAFITHAGPIQVLLAYMTGIALSANPTVEVACGAVVALTHVRGDTDNLKWELV